MTTDTAPRRKVMIVDDSGIIRKLAKRMIEHIGFDVVEADSGQRALEIYEQVNPAGVLLDWNMPGLNGMDVLRAIGQREGSRAKIIFCTTESTADKIAEALSAGADEFIMKPFDEEILRIKFLSVGLSADCSDQASAVDSN